MNAMALQLLQEAIKADEAFQAELVRQFGKRRAGDARYQPDTHDAATTAARQALHAINRQRDAFTVPVAFARAYGIECRDAVQWVREQIAEKAERTHADRCESAYEILRDLLDMRSEKYAIGGGVRWKEREAAIWGRAEELFEP